MITDMRKLPQNLFCSSILFYIVSFDSISFSRLGRVVVVTTAYQQHRRGPRRRMNLQHNYFLRSTAPSAVQTSNNLVSETLAAPSIMSEVNDSNDAISKKLDALFL